MRWAKNARNKIEKQGDLATLSQLQAELIFAYTGHPITNWIPTDLFSSTDQIRSSIPVKYREPHIINNGALSIKRRWVDIELPEYEILDALAHVYGQLSLMIIDLHTHCGLHIPPPDPKVGFHLLSGLLADGRLPSMKHYLDEMVIYVSLKDGSLIEMAQRPNLTDTKTLKEINKRYGDIKWQRLQNVKTLREIADVYFDAAQKVMLRDSYHTTVFILLKGLIPFEVIKAMPQERMDKYLLMKEVANQVRKTQADGVFIISEAWIAPHEDIPQGGYAVDAPNRKEVLALTAVDATGKHFTIQTEIERKKLKKHKVKRFFAREVDIVGKPISMAPVLEVWGKLDILGLEDKSIS